MFRRRRTFPIRSTLALALAIAMVGLVGTPASARPTSGAGSGSASSASSATPAPVPSGPFPGSGSANDPTVTFWETGLPAGTLWTAVLGGHRESVYSSAIRFTEPAGTYYWGVTTSAAYSVAPAPAGVVTVSNASISISLTFASPAQKHPIQHVVVIVLENEGNAEVEKYGTYEDYLASTYGEATAFYSACHHSLPNYLAMVAAVTNQCSNNSTISDAYHTYDNASVGDLLRAGGLTWAQFAESLPTTFNCSHPGASAYVGNFMVHHVPFAYFANSTTDPPADYGADYCQDHILSSSVFNGSAPGGINSTSFVNFSFYTPNDCDDGHNLCQTSPLCPSGSSGCDEVVQADTWLRGLLGSLLNGTGPYAGSPNATRNVAHTAFIVTYDESGNPTNYSGYAVAGADQGSAYGYCLNSSVPTGSGDVVCGGLVPLMVISPFGASGERMTVDTSPYSVAATVEWLFGLAGPKGTGLDNPGEFDYLYRWADPGFPTFEWLLGLSGDGYSSRL